MKLRVAIHGFGRIGHSFLRIILTAKYVLEKLDIMTINIKPSDLVMLAHFFKYDTLIGIFIGNVSYNQKTLIINIITIVILVKKDSQRIV
mgnify:CR=1 FL=1